MYNIKKTISSHALLLAIISSVSLGNTLSLDEILSEPLSGKSQSEGYLRTLGNSKEAIFKKIEQALSSPRVISGSWDIKNVQSYEKPNPARFETVIRDAILTERNNPDYYFFYHSAQKAGVLFALLRTLIDMHENDWHRDDFLILRSKKFLYPLAAKSAADYIARKLRCKC